MFLGISLRIPLILVITLQDRKTLFCVFFHFRDLYGLKLTGDFSRIIIFQDMMIRSFETTQTESQRRKEGARAPTPWGAPPMLFFASSLRSHPSKAPEGSLDLKTPHIKAFGASRVGRRRRSKNTKIESLLAAAGGRLEGEPLPESPPAASPPSPTPPHQSP